MNPIQIDIKIEYFEWNTRGALWYDMWCIKWFGVISCYTFKNYLKKNKTWNVSSIDEQFLEFLLFIEDWDVKFKGVFFLQCRSYTAKRRWLGWQGVFFSVNYLHELSVFTLREVILADLEGLKSQNFPGPSSSFNQGGPP